MSFKFLILWLRLTFYLCSEEMEMVNFHPWKRIFLRVLKLFIHILCRFATQTTKSSFFLTFPSGAIFQLESLLFVSGILPIYPGPLQGKYAAQNKVPTHATELDSTKTTPRPSNFSWPIGFSLTWSLTPVFSVIVPSDPTPLLRFSAFNCCKYIIHRNCYCKYLFQLISNGPMMKPACIFLL